MRRAAILVAALAAGPVAAEVITGVEFTNPTTRYPHGVLGDAVEWGGYRAVLDTGIYAMALPQSHVFEDIAPRLWDVTGDGAPEIVVVETDVEAGAALAIYGPRGKLAETPHIGQRNRWLAPVGAADLDGDGHVEIAYVDRPHLAKTLRIWRFVEGALEPVVDVEGLTNHRIGEDFITSGLRDCGTGPELVTVDASWSHLMVTRAEGGRWLSYPVTPFTGPASLADVLACEAGAG